MSSYAATSISSRRSLNQMMFLISLRWCLTAMNQSLRVSYIQSSPPLLFSESRCVWWVGSGMRCCDTFSMGMWAGLTLSNYMEWFSDISTVQRLTCASGPMSGRMRYQSDCQEVCDKRGMTLHLSNCQLALPRTLAGLALNKVGVSVRGSRRSSRLGQSSVPLDRSRVPSVYRVIFLPFRFHDAARVALSFQPSVSPDRRGRGFSPHVTVSGSPSLRKLTLPQSALNIMSFMYSHKYTHSN